LLIKSQELQVRISVEGTDFLGRLAELEGPGKRFVEDCFEEVGNRPAHLQERLAIVERDLVALENMKRIFPGENVKISIFLRC